MNGKTLRLLLVASVLVFALAAFVSAVGTPAGTEIKNTATLTYDDFNGNAMPLVNSNTVTTVVSQVAGVDLSPESASQTGFASKVLTFPVLITNTGNGDDSYALALTGVLPGWTAVVYRDDNKDGVLQPGETTVVSNTGTMAHDTTYGIIVKVTIPGTVPDGTVSTMTLTGTSAFNGTVYDTSLMTVTINQAVVEMMKVASVYNPKPGDEITYTITYDNTGSAAAHNFVITDLLNVNLQYVAGSMVFDSNALDMTPGVVLTDAADADNGNFGVTAPNTVTVTVGNVPAGASGTLVFRVMVKPDIPSGTTISNVARASYMDPDDNPLTMDSEPENVTVSTKAGVDLHTAVTTINASPGDTIIIPFSVTNTGNAPDTFDGSYSSTLLTYEMWIDYDGNGIIDNGDVLATDTDGDGYPDTGTLDQFETKYFIAKAVVPPGTPDLSTDVLTMTGTSNNDPTVHDTISTTTVVHAPRLTMVKSVSPEGPQSPMTVLTYTLVVTNNGTGLAKNLLITDAVPVHTTYVPGSITINGVGRTDASDVDGGTFAGGSVVVNWNQLAGNGGTLTITFQVTID